jgi:hypothetical protein
MKEINENDPVSTMMKLFEDELHALCKRYGFVSYAGAFGHIVCSVSIFSGNSPQGRQVYGSYFMDMGERIQAELHKDYPVVTEVSNVKPGSDGKS